MEMFRARRASSPSPGGTFGLSLGVAVDEEASEEVEAPAKEEGGDSRRVLLFIIVAELASPGEMVFGEMREVID